MDLYPQKTVSAGQVGVGVFFFGGKAHACFRTLLFLHPQTLFAAERAAADVFLLTCHFDKGQFFAICFNAYNYVTIYL